MELTIVTLIISMLLFFILFFGIGFLLNMLLRMSWIMAVVYPVITIFIIDDVRLIEYFTDTAEAFQGLGNKIVSLAPADITILTCGFAGAVAAGYVIKLLRKKGYQMF